MTEIELYALALLTADETGNAFGVTGVLDKYGNIFGFVILVFGLIFLYFSFKLKKMGGFYLESQNHDPIIKETGYLPGEAKVGERRKSEILGKTFSEMQLIFELDGETYEKWTPDLGSEGSVKIEYNPENPSEFYISDKLQEDDEAPSHDEDGKEVEELKEPPNKAFIAMLVFSIVLLALGAGFLYDFYLL